MKTITAYKITCTKAYSIHEQGSGLSLEPWGEDTDRYEGYDEPVEIEIDDDLRIGMSTGGMKLLYKGGHPYGMDIDHVIYLGYARVINQPPEGIKWNV